MIKKKILALRSIDIITDLFIKKDLICFRNFLSLY